MRVITAQEINAVMTIRELAETLRRAFRTGCITPPAHHLRIERPNNEATASLVLMPSWNDFRAQGTSDRGFIGTKISSVIPENRRDNLPTVMGVYLLQSGKTGQPLAVLDGRELTLWRASATSALASSYLSREDSKRLLMIGAGGLAPFLIRAHCAVRPISEVLIWNRTNKTAESLAARVKIPGVKISATADLEGAVRGADIISCATLSTDPLVHGAWLSAGCHLDLMGAYLPHMRECDDQAVQDCRLFVDSYEGALSRAGDLVRPLEDNLITRADIAADLTELCQGTKAGRRFYDQKTLFKSVGTAIEDLAAASHVFMRV
ncbi:MULTISPECIES: ornithine cyclodeaminase family protein [Pseudovibrio]|uniref:ornithine cyclodeaminase family protein n=1 Tax=Stappiaceae TaxID=2821832 RepID=UPI0023669301|nr:MULTISPECIES: ornithine cyclodeaminase family protein [Pseudovibrio]MDD7909784.1 ornithine cyclodeaminase family protein [Pseudovibrio exalbescens]MDX5592124.1 ornithine cyclodeaminase family protein [Pseudovibrio sp. SPO723]